MKINFSKTEKIKYAAADRDLDLNDPADEYTLRCALRGRMQYSSVTQAIRMPRGPMVDDILSNTGYMSERGPVGGFAIMEVERYFQWPSSRKAGELRRGATDLPEKTPPTDFQMLEILKKV